MTQLVPLSLKANDQYGIKATAIKVNPRFITGAKVSPDGDVIIGLTKEAQRLFSNSGETHEGIGSTAILSKGIGVSNNIDQLKLSDIPFTEVKLVTDEESERRYLVNAWHVTGTMPGAQEGTTVIGLTDEATDFFSGHNFREGLVAKSEGLNL